MACSICISPQRVEIDEALSHPKVSLRGITRQFPEFGRTTVRNPSRGEFCCLRKRLGLRRSSTRCVPARTAGTTTKSMRAFWLCAKS